MFYQCLITFCNESFTLFYLSRLVNGLTDIGARNCDILTDRYVLPAVRGMGALTKFKVKLNFFRIVSI